MLSGIPASNYSQVSYFPLRENYDEFYGFIIRVVNIAFEKFATFVQALLVQHLRTFGDKQAEWYEEWWTGARGRYCLCHCMHGGTNNDMGVEVDWRYIKKICPPSLKLSSFLGALVHFMKQLGKGLLAALDWMRTSQRLHMRTDLIERFLGSTSGPSPWGLGFGVFLPVVWGVGFEV